MAYTRICQGGYSGAYAGQLTYIEYQILSKTSNSYTVRLQYVGYSGSGGYSWNGDTDTRASFQVNGNSVLNNAVATFDYRNAGTYRVFATYDITLPHGRTYGVSAWHNSGVSLGTSSCSGSFTLPTLATSSKVTSMPSTWNDDENYTYSFSNPSSGRRATLILTADKASNFANFDPLPGNPATIKLSDASKNALWKAYQNQNSVTVTFAHCTYEGSSQVDIDWKNVTINCQNADPTAPKITVEDTNKNTAAYTGSSSKMVVGYSDLKCTVKTPSTGKKSATISKYIFNCGDVKKEVEATAEELSVTFPGAKSNVIQCIAEDSRGNRASIQKELSVVSYTPVSLPNVTATRTNAGKGTNVVLSWTKTGTPTAYSYKWGPSGGSLTVGTVAISPTATSVTLTHNFNAGKAYTVVLTAKDLITEVSTSVTVGIARVPVKFLKDGNIKVRSDALLERDTGDTRTILDAVYPIGSIYMSVNNANPGAFLGGTWEAIEGCFLLGQSPDYEAGTTGGEAEHTLTTNEIPKHNHSFRINIQHGDGPLTSGEALTSELQRNGRIRYLGTTKEAGEDKPHNNMPPYLAVYIWKRTK